jgi:hypothetical protein
MASKRDLSSVWFDEKSYSLREESLRRLKMLSIYSWKEAGLLPLLVFLRIQTYLNKIWALIRLFTYNKIVIFHI